MILPMPVAGVLIGSEIVMSAGDEAVRIIPSLLWIAFAVAALILFYRPLRDEVLPRLSSLKLPGGISLELRERIQSAAKRQGVTVSEDDNSRIVRRLERLAPLVRGASILWVDENPANNASEASVLEAFGAKITTARTTEEAIKKLREHFDVVISDVKRENKDDEGARFAREIKGKPYTILYLRNYDPTRDTPAYAFAITNRPNQLLHYVLDVLERERS
jgi:CheY-like chemotaxis protein